MKNSAKITMLLAVLMGVSASVFADEVKPEYDMDRVYVEGKVDKDKFGNVVTEQSYYRTGGDVDVVNAEEIERKHYNTITDAVRRLPGVRVSETGYRGVDYGDSWAYNNTVSINGDNRVVVLVDGKRIDNTASSMTEGTGSGNAGNAVILDNVMDVKHIERIEVIKGPSASVYGADAIGGAINIITKKNAGKNRGSVDVATGSWKAHNYSISYSGVDGPEGNLKYMINASRQMGGDTHYHDGVTGKNYRYLHTDYKEDSVFLRVENDFSKTQNLRVTLNHGDGLTGFPYMAPDWSVDPKYNFKPYATVMTDSGNKGYRNTFLTGMLTGGNYNKYNKNDYEVCYTFAKENGMESFVRYYYNTRRYGGYSGYYTNTWPDEEIYPGGIFNLQWQLDHWRSTTSPTRWSQQQGKGVQLQLAKSIGVHDVIFSTTLDRSDFNSIRTTGTNAGTTTTERESISGYVQDKIHITDKWDLTPAIRYQHYKDTTQRTPSGEETVYEDTNSTKVTPVVSTQYAFDDTFSTYASWTSVFRPLKQADYTRTALNGPLKDEKGYIINWGIRKDLSEKTNVSLNYNYTDMSNKIGQFAVYENADDDESSSYYVNCTQKKQALSLGLDHRFDDHVTLNASYSWLKDKVKGKGEIIIDNDAIFAGNGGRMSIDSMLNKILPTNQYNVELSYSNKKFNANLSELIYSGCSTEAYTNHRFMVTNLNLNYEVAKNANVYFAAYNLFNEAYETKFYPHTGKGAYPGLGRHFMVGLKYRF